MFLFKVAEPNEALIISGIRAHRGSEGDAAGLGFKIVVGKGAFTIPGLQKVRRLSLDIHEAELDLECVTTQGIRVTVKAVVIYKIADDFQSIANAARRFLDQEEQMDVKVHNVFAGHLRSIVGTMTIEDLIRNRDALTKATRESAATEMQRLGLTIDSLQVQEIEDASGYIENLSAPEASRVAKEARIAQAAADREATEREQEADALKVAARSQSQIKQAQAQAEAQRAQAEAEQAGPLAAATAKQQVVVQETKVAQFEAERTEQKLQTDVRKPADADAYKTRTLAEAERDARISQAEAHAREVELEAAANAKRVKLEAEANSTRTRQIGEAEAAATKARGLAEGDAVKAKGLAEAEAIKARADALAHEPGGGDRPADRRAAPADRRRGGEGVRQHRAAHRPQRRRGHRPALHAGARDGRGGDPDAARDARPERDERLAARAGARAGEELTARGTGRARPVYNGSPC